MPTLLTREVIDSAKPNTRTFDSKVEGLALRVNSVGGRTFVLRYRHYGRRREIVIGKASDLTATEARRLARKRRAELSSGADPLETKDSLRRAKAAEAARLTLKEFSEIYTDSTIKKESSKRSDESILRLHILPKLGNVPVSEITRLHAQRLHDDLADTPTRANRAFALLSHMLTVAAAKGYREAPLPRRCIVKNPERPRDRYLNPAETTRLIKILTAMDASPHRDGAQALRLLILTGCRKNEIVRLSWAEVDKANRCLRLVDGKTGKRTVPLIPEALAIIEARRKGSRCGWVFPNEEQDGPRESIEMAWRSARDAAKLSGVRIHDLRHSFAAAAVMEGLTLSEIGKLLGHKAPATTARYAHVSDAVARAAADKVGKRFRSIVRGAAGLRVAK